MDDIWGKNIYDSIKAISDIERQRKAWLGKDKNRAASFLEDTSMLYDSFDFSNFLEDDYYKLEALSKNLYKELLCLHHLLDKYDKNGKSDEEILVDPEWMVITKQARKVIEIWNIENPSMGKIF